MFSKKSLEVIPEENTSIWTCSNDTCMGWMRDNFSFEVKPSCPLCQSDMVNDDKVLPVLVNNNKTIK
jgi:hypothetical protein